MTHRPVVEFVSLVLSHYRVAFHQLVHDDLARDGIDYRLTYSAPVGGDVAKSDTARLAADWVTTIGLRAITVGHRRLYWQAAREAARTADLVIVGQETKLLFNYWLMARQFLGGPRMAYFGHGRNYQSKNPNGPSERLKRALATRVHWWFAYTPGVAETVASLGFPRDRITVNFNSIDTGALRADLKSVTPDDIAAARREFSITSDNICIYVGGMYAEKRLDFLVEAAVEIRRMVPDFHLILVGSGSHRRIAEDAARRHEFIHMAGPRFGRDKAVLLAMAKAFLMPGLVGLAILDAFAAGCPLVTTAIAYHSPEIEYLRDGENGLIVEDWQRPKAYADAVAGLLTDADLQARLSAAARRDCETYSIERMAAAFAEGIRRALA